LKEQVDFELSEVKEREEEEERIKKEKRHVGMSETLKLPFL
jgi:hypothetical protein